MAKLKNIIIHCSDSDFGTADIIREWHTSPPRNWKDIGYNGVILNGRTLYNNDYNPEKDGVFEIGRGLDLNTLIESDEIGAHARGYNTNSIGICLIGKTKFTVKQFETLFNICKLYTNIIPNLKIFGHCGLPGVSKTCPNFSMDNFRKVLEFNRYDDIKKLMKGDIK
jgi:hypothetical protein